MPSGSSSPSRSRSRRTGPAGSLQHWVSANAEERDRTLCSRCRVPLPWPPALAVWCSAYTCQRTGRKSLPGAGWRRSGRLAPVSEEARPRPWRLPPSGGPRVRPERPGGAAIVFARRSDGRRAMRSRSCVPSVELTVVRRCCSRLCRLLQLMNPTVASFRPGPSAAGALAPHAATGGTCADAAVPGRGPGHCGRAPGGPWSATAPAPACGRTPRGRSGGHPTGDVGGAARRSRPQPRRTGAWDCSVAGGSDPADRACLPVRTAAASCAGSGVRCRTGPRPSPIGDPPSMSRTAGVSKLTHPGSATYLADRAHQVR